MAPRKRSAAEAHDEADYEEQVMDPKLEPEPEENGPFSDEEMQPPPKKHKGAAVGGKRAGAGVSPLKGKGRANDEAEWKCNDWNPSGALHDDHTPRAQLGEAMEKLGRRPEGAVRHVVYWMRMRDMRIEDNRALALASELVQQGGKGSHLIVLHVLSPGDFAAHDRSPRRIDFVLRTLAKLREQLAELDIPLYVTSHNERKKIPHRVLELCNSWGVSDITGNIEHEVDELWRDIATVQQGPKAGVHPHFVEDTYVVPPGAVKTNDGRPYSVFSPWNRRWTEHLSKHPELLDESPLPERNDASIRKDSKLGKLFEQEVPEAVPGFECEDREYMHKLWPAGSDAARRVLELFIGGKKGQMDFEADATGVDQPMTDDGAKDSKIAAYGTARNILSEHGTSRLSPYLSAGVISARACLRASRDVTKGKLQIGRDSGPAMWGVEVAFRDFYGHVLSAWPRVCMSRAYLLKYEDVKWEYDDEKLKAWMAGRTGYPIVDAAQRQGAKQGYMHNRGRMIVAMFRERVGCWMAGSVLTLCRSHEAPHAGLAPGRGVLYAQLHRAWAVRRMCR
jgi:deoxyribodipyrimidine photo-lyase